MSFVPSVGEGERQRPMVPREDGFSGGAAARWTQDAGDLSVAPREGAQVVERDAELRGARGAGVAGLEQKAVPLGDRRAAVGGLAPGAVRGDVHAVQHEGPQVLLAQRRRPQRFQARERQPRVHVTVRPDL
jgi:hypothetical protein